MEIDLTSTQGCDKLSQVEGRAESLEFTYMHFNNFEQYYEQKERF